MHNKTQIENIKKALIGFRDSPCDGKCSKCSLSKAYQNGDSLCDTLLSLVVKLCEQKEAD